ncbi:uncharacterized protein Pyn_16949 [Prunus yedoensis var. nudiflora]|uniref:Uncharacterized protein n=1 Tax=Prunus yedoensis var. nudiflora TaxID=2094558 RepID=A0A314Y6K8_PRUYE|nr:uncharacterized protein Pyn_16949 [Prunus yedoensis var. nudiflora]
MAETGSSSRAIQLDHIQEEIEEVSAVPEVKEKKKSRNTLRKGSKGEEVRPMQEALQKLGFYSVEEDMEFSSFSSGNRTCCQDLANAPQDGIVTAELLEQLYTVAQIGGLENKGSTLTAAQKEDTNGAAVTSATEISEVQQTLVKEGVTKVEVSEHRVFLLGENRWEDSSRLSRNRKKGDCTSVSLITKETGTKVWWINHDRCDQSVISSFVVSKHCGSRCSFSAADQAGWGGHTVV